MEGDRTIRFGMHELPHEGVVRGNNRGLSVRSNSSKSNEAPPQTDEM